MLSSISQRSLMIPTSCYCSYMLNHVLNYIIFNILLIPLCFLTKDNYNARKFNLVYSAWEPLDQMLLTWLQFRLSHLVLSKVLGSVYYYQVWNKVLNTCVLEYDKFLLNFDPHFLRIVPCQSFLFVLQR